VLGVVAILFPIPSKFAEMEVGGAQHPFIYLIWTIFWIFRKKKSANFFAVFSVHRSLQIFGFLRMQEALVSQNLNSTSACPECRSTLIFDFWLFEPCDDESRRGRDSHSLGTPSQRQQWRWNWKIPCIFIISIPFHPHWSWPCSRSWNNLFSHHIPRQTTSRSSSQTKSPLLCKHISMQ